MKDDIVGKLKRHLSDPITTECAAIYLLVQVRKILEKSQPTPPPFVLWMYCHWAVHVDLTRDKMMRCFLEKIDRYVLNNVSGFQEDEEYSFKDEHELFRELLSFNAFRKELCEFLNVYSLPTSLCDDDASWFGFLSAYAGVIEDGTLSAQGPHTLKAIEQVVFAKGGLGSFENDQAFSVHWAVKLTNGQTLKFEDELIPARNMSYGSIQLCD